MSHISSQQSGITRQELMEAIPVSLQSKDVHLHWIDKSPSGKGNYTLTAKIEVNGQVLLLHCETCDQRLLEDWNVTDPSYHTNARLVSLERILTDPSNEEKILTI